MQVGQLLQNKDKNVLVYYTPFCDHRTQRHRKTIDGSRGGGVSPEAPPPSELEDRGTVTTTCLLFDLSTGFQNQSPSPTRPNDKCSETHYWN